MSAGTERHLVVARLRDEIRRIERRPGRRDGVVASGHPDVDDLLPGGGFPRGALTELTGGWASGKTAVALSVLAAMRPDELAAYVDGRGELYPPGAAILGVDLSRLLVVRPVVSPAGSGGERDACAPVTSGSAWAKGQGERGPRDPVTRREPAASGEGGASAASAALWAAEALLGSGAFAAVVIDVSIPRALRGGDAVARRLQAAAEKGGAVGLWLATPGTALRLPAAARLELRRDEGRIVARKAAPAPLRAAGGGDAA